ncbi:MAG: hypothetical protein ACOYYF_04785 [Chloroflexota bacterium]|nr:hypothetical protein [Chloroflexota bacterium]MBI5702827.1 hypothetical protein [Chloroflexota bacterium]
MNKIKWLFTLFLGIALLAAQAGPALAAPAQQDGFITGTVTEAACETDDAGVTTVLLTVQLADETTQTVRISQETAVTLGILAPDTPCSEEALAGAIGMEVSIDPSLVIPEDDEEEQGWKHPVAYALSLFFKDVTDYETIMAAHEDGTGFGVITQALWMTTQMEGDSEVFLAILQAKETGDYSAFTLEDGTVPQNWGQFKKALKEKKANLGAIMSNRDQQGTGDEVTPTGNNGQGSDKSNNGNGKGKGKGKND